MNPEILRPNKRVFIWRPIIRAAIINTVLAIAGFFFFPLFTGVDPGPLVWVAAVIGTVTALTVHRIIAFNKTFYEFHGDRLIVKTGSLAKSSTIDLPYRNVTQVVLRLPWLEHRFFATGHLRVHAAGSARGVALLKSIDEPHKLYQKIAAHLRDSGFSLARKERLQREKPHLVGTALDTSGMAISGLIAMVVVAMTIAGSIIDILDLSNYFELFEVLTGTLEPDDGEEAALAARGTLGLALLTGLGGILGLAKLAIHFVDLNRRTYTLWDDVVDYEDGFLTETYKFIPVENLADTATSEPFLKRLFGMANVVLRPHGSAGGISFPSMPNAAQFRGHLDELIERSQTPEATLPDDRIAPGEVDADAEEADALGKTTGGAARRLPVIDEPPLEFSPSLMRRLITAIIQAVKFPATIALVAAVAYAAVVFTEFELEQLDLTADELAALDWTLYGFLGLVGLYMLLQVGRAIFFCMTTKYAVGRRKVTWERDFISRDEVEFTMDKITALEVERDVVDRLTGCATISFWSIGNDRPLIFEDVKKAAQRVTEIRRRLGLLANIDDADQTHRPSVSPLNFALGRLYSNLFWLLLAAGAAAFTPLWEPALYVAAAIALIPLLRFVQQALYHRFGRLFLFGDHLRIRQGILFITDQYVAYDQLRSQVTTRYPLRKAGTLRLIPGSNRTMGLPFLRDIAALHEDLDERLYAHPMRAVAQAEDLDRTVVSTHRPQARNALVLWTLLTLLIAILTVIPALLVYLWYRRTSIVVEEGRVRRLRGLLYRTTQTVLVNRIDQILIDRGPLNTLFKNGKVSILTVGSSLPTLSLGPIKQDQALYDQLEERTQSGS